MITKFLRWITLITIWSICLGFSLKTKHHADVKKRVINARPNISVALISFILTIMSAPHQSHADMLTFPLPQPLKNNIMLMRSGESFADAANTVQTNPVKKLRTDNALTAKGREQVIEATKEMIDIDFSPSFIWTSNTERSYETAKIVAQELQLGQNRIIPEYSFLDSRSMGTYENSNAEAAYEAVHEQDRKQGINYKPPPNNDGTPSESVTDVLVRGNQLVSTMESMYSGENILIVSPDSENLSILSAALYNEDPDKSLPIHAQFSFKNGEIRRLVPFVKLRETLVTGQTQAEAEVNNRKMRALRLAGAAKGASNGVADNDWSDFWHASVDSVSL